MDWKYLCLLLIHAFLIELSIAGFYKFDKNVIELTQTNFKDLVFNEDHASIVEFYNSFCGACRRYSSTWKSFAADIRTWKDVVKVAAVDCSENDDLCRDYEVNYFPSIRYFSPYLKDDPEHKYIGERTATGAIRNTKASIVNYLQNETVTPKHWPDLKPVVNLTDEKDLFRGSDEIDFVIAVYPSRINQHIGYELALDYHKVKNILIKQIYSADVAKLLGMESQPTILAIGKDFSKEKLPTETYYNLKATRGVLEKFFTDHEIDFEHLSSSDVPEKDFDGLDDLSEAEIIILNKVKDMTDVVFQADLEKALKESLTIEVYKNREIQGEKLLALRKYVAIVKKCSPLGEKGRNFFDELTNFIESSGDIIEGVSYKSKVDGFGNRTEFFADKWVGCQGSAQNLRGYSCGLWMLYHYLTVCAAADTELSDPVEVLQAIHDYTKFFFGCSECAEHFQAMAVDTNMWNVTSKSEAILWLWRAHNSVNDRLIDDSTEDPLFPKIKFPSHTSCQSCRAGFAFNENEVLAFMQGIYSQEKIDKYGTESTTEIVTPQSFREENDNSLFLENLTSIIVVGSVCVLFAMVFMLIRKRKNNFTLDV